MSKPQCFRQIPAFLQGAISSIRAGMLFLVLATAPVSMAQASKKPSISHDVERVRFVGCPTHEMMGSILTPKDDGKVPVLTRSEALALALYASEGLRVLAPRGWHCFGASGANGAYILITPEEHDAEDFIVNSRKVSGPAVQLVVSYAGTSGRFDIADIAARVFPSKADFVQRVVAEGFPSTTHLSHEPFPDDKLIYRSPTNLEFLTPAHTQGLGTQSRLIENAEPIYGWISFFGKLQDMINLRVRMPKEYANVTATIIRSTQQQYSTGIR